MFFSLMLGLESEEGERKGEELFGIGQGQVGGQTVFLRACLVAFRLDRVSFIVGLIS